MPLPKRILIHNADLSQPEQLLENEAPVDLPTANFSRLLGSMRKLTILSSIATETFSNLGLMLEDIQERTAIIATRTEVAVKKLVEVEKGLRRLDLQPENNVISYSQKYFKKRIVTIPPLFIKATNYSSIKVQYKLCREPPQLWRLENIVGDDLFQFFSFPGYFFQEWLRAELFKQERAKAFRKANKALKKQQKKEKKQRKFIESQKVVRTKSFHARPTSMKLLDKDNSPRPSNSGNSITSADALPRPSSLPDTQVATDRVSTAYNNTSSAPNNVNIRDNITSNRPVSTAAAKLFMDSPETAAAADVIDDTTSDAPIKKKKGGIKKVLGLFRSAADDLPAPPVITTSQLPSSAVSPANVPLNSTTIPITNTSAMNNNSNNNNWETASLSSYTAAATRPAIVPITLPLSDISNYNSTNTNTNINNIYNLGDGYDQEIANNHINTNNNNNVDYVTAPHAPQDFFQAHLTSSNSATSAAKRRKQQQQLVVNKYASKFQAKSAGDVLLSDTMDDQNRPISILPTKRQLYINSNATNNNKDNQNSNNNSISNSQRQPSLTTNSVLESETASSRTSTANKKRSSVLFATSQIAPKHNFVTTSEHETTGHDNNSNIMNNKKAKTTEEEEALLQVLLGADYRTVMVKDAVDDLLLQELDEQQYHTVKDGLDVEKDDYYYNDASFSEQNKSKTDFSFNKDEDDEEDEEKEEEERMVSFDDPPPPPEEDEENEEDYDGNGYVDNMEENEDEYANNKNFVAQNRPPPPPPINNNTNNYENNNTSNIVVRAPPPPPPVIQLKSSIGTSVLETIRSGAPALRKVDPEALMKAKTPDLRTNILNSIKSGKTTLRHVTAEDRVKVSAARQNEAIQRLLANRRDIAGSDSEDDSDSDQESDFSF